MRIASFDIRSIRGIRHFEAKPNGNSIVIAGPNGTGKSGVIDAIDFLFSGNIQRLSGKGTGSLSLDVHGKHVDDKVADSYVSAVMQLNNGKSVTIRRALSDKKLELLAGDAADFQAVNETFASGQFQLTRRELLQFIVSDGSTRADEIQELLDVSELDKLRKDLAAVVKNLSKQKDIATQTRDGTLRDIDLLLDNKNKDKTKRRARVNELRALLKKDPIINWSKDTNIAADLEQPEAKEASALKRKEFQKGIDALALERFPVPSGADGLSAIAAMKGVVTELSVVENTKERLRTYELLQLGLAQVRDDGSCPLCDTKWNKHDLLAHIKEKIALTAKLKALATKFDLLASSLGQQVDDYLSTLHAANAHAKRLGNADLGAVLTSLIEDLQARRKTLGNIEALAAIRDLLDSDKGHISAPSLAQIVTIAATVAAKLPEESPEELAYKTLLRVSGLYQNVLASGELAQELSAKKEIAVKAQNAYEVARKNLFTNLYKDVEKDFQEFYVALNDDESTFKAKIDDKGSSVDLTVDFYGRGMYPPIALHSEGHQDSMGVCLYLALMKKLKSEGFTIAMLDDVMMSIDIGHRRRLCQLLKDRFPKTQFIITTHDDVWARQLKEFKIVDQANVFQFRSWSLESGPVVDTKGAYDALREHAKKNDIVAAAAGLRNNLERELQEVCALLHAKVVYREHHQWNPGELREYAIGQLNKLLGKAKNAASSWKNDAALASLSAIEQRLKDKNAAAKTDDWQVNAAVHYNPWAKFTQGEMLATIDAMEALVTAFCCAHCGGKFFVAFQGLNAVSLSCMCGQAAYTFTPKKA